MARVYTAHWKDYELIDAGNNQKLERWGKVITIRPERNAYFKPVLKKSEWLGKAHFQFTETSRTKGTWESLNNELPKNWQISCRDLTFNLKLTQFKHVGIFPEQKTNWDFITSNLNEGDKFLNLFERMKQYLHHAKFALFFY